MVIFCYDVVLLFISENLCLYRNEIRKVKEEENMSCFIDERYMVWKGKVFNYNKKRLMN